MTQHTPIPAVNPHRTTRPEDTQAGDDQREALAALNRIVRQVPYNLRSNPADYTVTGDIAAVKAALSVYSLNDRDWSHAQERLQTLHSDLAAARDALAARPSAPTVTTEQERVAGVEADRASGRSRGTSAWRRAYLRALGIEVTR